MTAFPDTKAREKLTMLKWLLIITNIWYFVCITVAAMLLNFKLLNLVMNFKKKNVRSKTHYMHVTEEKPAGNSQNSLRGVPETSQCSDFK